MSGKQPPSKYWRGGFTMLELLVAMALMLTLVVMLFSLVDAATKLWKDNENRVDAYREARAALNVISSDVRSMLATTNTNFFATNPIGATRPDITNGLFFLTCLPSASQAAADKGEICAVGYYRTWEKQSVNFGSSSSAELSKPGFQLFRSMTASDATMASLTNANPQPLKDIVQPGADNSEVLARNILNIEFRFYETNVAGSTFKTWIRTAASPLPQMIEIRITALSDDYARRLDGDKARWTTNEPSMTNNMRTFISRVNVPRIPAN